MTKENIKQIAIQMVQEGGLINLSRSELCERAGIPDGSFPHVMGGTFAEFVEELNAEGINASPTTVSKRRANPALRKESILDAAMTVAKERGYRKVTRDLVATGANISPGLVSRYFGTMAQLQRDIIRRAIKDEVLEVVAQGLANGDKHALKASKELKTKAAHFLTQL